MRIAYLILAHNTPRHLPRLIQALHSESSECFVHLDRKSRSEKFRRAMAEPVQFTRKRRRVHWAEFSIVEATLILIRAALEDPRGFDRFVLLSGADYPLWSAASIETFFEAHREKEFIDLVPLSADPKRLRRIENYCVPRRYPAVFRRAIHLLQRCGVLPETRCHRDYLGDREPFYGSQWWALTREACETILEFAVRERRAVRFFRRAACSDECFFHTIIGNSPLCPRACRSLTYADWGRGSRRHPAKITPTHLDGFRPMFSRPIGEPVRHAADEKRVWLFARKFPDKSGDLVEELNTIREGAPAVPTVLTS
jgi:hypothetical protein